MKSFYSFLKETAEEPASVFLLNLYKSFDKMILWYLGLSYSCRMFNFSNRSEKSLIPIELLNELGKKSHNGAELFLMILKNCAKQNIEHNLKAKVIAPIILPRNYGIIQPGEIIKLQVPEEHYPSNPRRFIIDYRSELLSFPLKEIFDKVEIDWKSNYELNKVYPTLRKNLHGPAGDFIFYSTEYHIRDPFITYVDSMYLPHNTENFIKNYNDFLLEIKEYLNENIYSCAIDDLGEKIYSVLMEYKDIKIPELKEEFRKVPLDEFEKGKLS